MGTSILSIEDKIESCFSSGVYLLVGLPMVCVPQFILFGKGRDDIKDTAIYVLNIRLCLALVTGVYTYDLAESLGDGTIKSLSFAQLLDCHTSNILPFPLSGNHQSNVVFAVSAARLRGEEYKTCGTGIPVGSSFFQAAVTFFACSTPKGVSWASGPQVMLPFPLSLDQ